MMVLFCPLFLQPGARHEVSRPLHSFWVYWDGPGATQSADLINSIRRTCSDHSFEYEEYLRPCGRLETAI